MNAMASSKRQGLKQFVEDINRSGGTYHQIDWGDGLVMKGIYDMKKYLPHYRLPNNLRGKTALDVGTASGFFAFECARRGARVTAIDIFDNRNIFFATARDAGLDVQYVTKSIYDLTAAFGQFDLVVCGSLLLHLRDPFGAIQCLRSVCRGTAIVSTASFEDPSVESKPYCEFKGIRTTAGDGEYWHYWEMNGAAMKKMLTSAGFSKAEETGRFWLEALPGMPGCTVPHVVVQGSV